MEPCFVSHVDIFHWTMCMRKCHIGSQNAVCLPSRYANLALKSPGCDLPESQNAAETASGKQSKGRKRKQVLMSDSDEPGGEESAPDSGSDWSQTGKQAAASSDADHEDDDVSMADDSDDSPAQAGKGQSSSRKRAKPTPVSAHCSAFK